MPQYDLETTPPALPIAAGTSAHDVIRLQEWLVVRAVNIGTNPGAPLDTPAAAGIDGGFGGQTQGGCNTFATANNLPDGTVDPAFWQALTSGMRAAFDFRSDKTDIGAAVVETAQAHLAQKPLEARRQANGHYLGQDNSGPWVRAYCDGLSTEWCQGAASHWVRQAFAALGRQPPFPLDAPQVLPLYVPSVAAAASKAKRLILGTGSNPVPPGSFFFVKGTINGAPGYIHVGVTTSPMLANGFFRTIEGNTNTDGSSNGWEVCDRQRPRNSCDFGILA